MSDENKPADVLAVEKSFDDNFECVFSVDEYNRHPDITAIAIHTDLPLDFDVAYSGEEERKTMLNLLTKLSEKFDFSFNLDFEELDELENFVAALG
ncbi:MAG: hypothetical protein VYA60_07985 [Pseudomonadota bacterium]|nr:hypothetical protein [Pseudomonadota bacterium]